jgi:hypothetical protein
MKLATAMRDEDDCLQQNVLLLLKGYGRLGLPFSLQFGIVNVICLQKKNMFMSGFNLTVYCDDCRIP